ncbi:N-acetylmuramoyl-L-alanine amidase [Escherichia coli]
MLVIHYTADDFDSSLATLTDKQVSSHYLVLRYHRDTTVNRASGNWCRNKNWPGMRGLAPGAGQRALTTPHGIELENRGWQKSAGVKYFAPFEPAQIQALIPLAKILLPVITSSRKT